MKTLIHVVRGTPERGLDFFVDVPVTYHPQVISVNEFDGHDTENILKEGTFFLVTPRDTEVMMNLLAKKNPGREVRAYVLQQVAEAAVGDVYVKKVTEDGILPN